MRCVDEMVPTQATVNGRAECVFREINGSMHDSRVIFGLFTSALSGYD
jgi:hypothetical protein